MIKIRFSITIKPRVTIFSPHIDDVGQYIFMHMSLQLNFSLCACVSSWCFDIVYFVTNLTHMICREQDRHRSVSTFVGFCMLSDVQLVIELIQNFKSSFKWIICRSSLFSQFLFKDNISLNISGQRSQTLQIWSLQFYIAIIFTRIFRILVQLQVYRGYKN